MTTQRRGQGRRAFAWVGGLCLLASVMLALVPCVGHGAPTVSAVLGFNQHLHEGSFAPMRADVRGLPSPIRGRLILVQTLGSGWRGESTVTHELASGPIENGTYAATVPFYDATNPVVLRLITPDSQVIAETRLDPRIGRHTHRFAVSVGAEAPPVVDAVPAEPVSLSTDWWSYEGLSSLWVESPLPRAAWNAIGRWVYAGGRLVVFGGDNYLRMDTPVLREILPLETPRLISNGTGPAHLAGHLRSDSTVLREQNGTPLVIHRTLGAGTVTLVTVSSRDMDENAYGPLLGLLQSATPIALSRLAGDSLSATSVTGPRHATVGLLVVALLACVSLGYALHRRQPRLAMVIVSLGIGFLAVLSGFYSFRTNQNRPLYTCSYTFSLEDSFGSVRFGHAWYSLQSMHVALENRQAISEPKLHVQPGADLDSYVTETSLHETRLALASLQMRTADRYGIPASTITLSVGEGWVEVDSTESETYDDAWLLQDGRVYSLPSIAPGVHRHVLGTGQPVDRAVESMGAASAELAPLYGLLEETGIVFEGTWLLIASHRVVSQPSEEVAHSRSVILRAIPGGDHAA